MRYISSNPTTSLVKGIGRIKKEYKDKGLFYILKTSAFVAFDLIRFNLMAYRKQSKYFTFRDSKYKYYYHWYNRTWENERAIEIPIIYKLLLTSRHKKVLEIGNVLSYYFPVNHDILDKYDLTEGIIKEDIAGFKPVNRYDLIVSVSTLEHVGRDELPNDPKKVIKVIKRLKLFLKPKGKAVFTFPFGYNAILDKAIAKRDFEFERLYVLKRISENNTWREIETENNYQQIKSLISQGQQAIGIIEIKR